MAKARRKLTNLPVTPVPRDTLPDQIYRRTKDLILDGEIEPGQLVTIQGLADAFGVSAMPVREALQRLIAEKALSVVSGRSVGLAELSGERLRDLRRVRLRIESLAAEWAAEQISNSDLKQLTKLVATMDIAATDGDSHRYVRANREFHFTVYRASNSETLLSIIEGLWLQVSPYFHLLHDSGNYADANEQHKQVLNALRDRDGEAAGAYIRADIEAATEILLDLLG
ncbi:MAG: GntR family transcriptional regulator [Alphaproteobacteria bacterium]